MHKSILFVITIAALTACVRNQPQVIVITSSSPISDPIFLTPTLDIVDNTVIPPSVIPAATRYVEQQPMTEEYVVQPGDTLYGIALQHNLSVEAILQLNELPDPNILTVGQIIKLPPLPDETSAAFNIVPDGRLVRGPGSLQFSVRDFIEKQSGYIRLASDIVDDKLLSASEVVERIAVEFSVDSRLLLALLEYQNNWLTKSEQQESAKAYPIQGQPSSDGVDRSGLYKQLAWTANQLNRGYYSWKYAGVASLELQDGTRLRYIPELNAGTVGVQYLFGQMYDVANWSKAVSADGLFQTYIGFFGDPFDSAAPLLVPAALRQPEFTLPFPQGQTWFFTGGPHGGWGTGSAWSAVDFAPPDDRPEGSPLCYVSDFEAVAVTGGIITRSKDGMVLLDVDGDGDETTGWVVMYLHIASEGRVQIGTYVQSGDFIGRPSCEGGFSTATHMHIARRYNGEWMPVNCELCINFFPAFVMSGWTFYGLTNQEYQGYMLHGNEKRIAEQGRLTSDNLISW